MTSFIPRECILLDTEYTAWEGSMERKWSGPNEFREMVQIGALHIRDLSEVDAFSSFIKPVKNPVLSDYFVSLTGITQEKIDREGMSLEEALKAFKEFSQDMPLCSYGHDTEHIKANCELLGIPFPFTQEYMNIAPALQEEMTRRGIDHTKYTSGTLIKAFGKTGAPAHDAVNDMRNLLEVLKTVA